MFAEKKQKITSLILSVMLGLSVLWLAAAPIQHGVAHAYESSDILTFLGCDDDNGDGLNITDCLSSGSQGPVTSFIDFKGDLTPPNPEGYAAGLTQATDARTYILNVTNFFLGFLGLIAVLVVIYGGVLAVTSMGNPDGMNKGKKAITYAGIGLLIVMSSFALVNTILLAPGGRETAGGAGGVTSTTIRGVAGNQRFNYLAQQIDQVILKVYNSYQFHLQAKQEIETARNNILAIDQSQCNVPMQNCVNDFRNRVQAQISILSNLTQQGNAQFNTGMAQLLADITKNTNEKLAEISQRISESDCNTSNKFMEEAWEAGGSLIGVSEEPSACYESDKRAIREEFPKAANTITERMLLKTGEQFLHRSYAEDLDNAYFMTSSVYQSVKGLASELIGQEYFRNLGESIIGSNPPRTAADVKISLKSEIDGFFRKEYTSMVDNLTIDKPLAINQDAIRNVLQNLIQIKSVLENIKFVNTVISADAVQGNAPLIVNFSSVGSTDPSGFTIEDKRIEWDLDGNGTYNEGEAGKDMGMISCNERAAATTGCIFTKAGTYRVSLRIKPKGEGTINPATNLAWEQEIAPGVAYIDILVNPPATKINLEVGPKAGPMRPVIKYDAQTGTVVEDHEKIYFTLAEAKAGLKFDASKSTFSDGETPIFNDPTSKIRWNFGVPSENNDTYQIPAVNTLSLEQVYPAVGNYQARFEVTDKNGVVDRKIFTVVVSNLAPRITNPPATGKINQELTFDGSDSTSDGGPIIFNWKVEKLEASAVTTAWWQGAVQLTRTAHAATIDLSKALTPVKPGISAVVAIPVKTLDPVKRSEKNEYYDCRMPEGRDDTLRCTFLKAGRYRVTLSLDDNGVPREESTEVVISSNAPVASFRPLKISPSAPALYKLDGKANSFDQDEKDNSALEYSWEINPDKCVLIGLGDQHTDADLLSTATDPFSAQTPCSKLKEFSTLTGVPVVKFTEKGDYSVNLVVRTNDEPDLNSANNEQTITVESVLDVAWGNMKPSAVLTVPGDTGTSSDQLPDAVNVEPVAPVTFLFSSSQAISYELEFGDGVLQSGEMIPGAYTTVIHNYDKTGKYEAKLSVYDADDIENSISRKIFIGDSDSPIAIITTKVNGSEVEPITIDLENNGTLANAIRVNRKDNLTFDAENSLNTDGTARRLTYSWNINNFEKQSTSRVVAHNFSTVSVNGVPYTVKLKVTNERDATQNGEDEVNILVVGEQPAMQSLTAVPTESDLTTPVTVKLTAVGAKDPDGQVAQYKWWYYDANRPATPEERLGLQITTVPTANLVIGTRGLEGEKPRYKFGVELTDNDNLSVSTDARDENKRLLVSAPELQVTNGPNKAPVARFTVDRTSVQVGEAVNFSSTSVDPDPGGGIKEYKWDFGDGTRGENRANVSHVYQKANVEGYRVRLTVVDNNASEATSDIMRIYVDAEAAAPVPGFTTAQQGGSKTVQFTDTSTADEAAGATIKKYSWDFDVAFDSNGDGKKDNDIDSGDRNPSYTYPNFGIYRAKLTVEDSQGQVRSVTNFVNLKPAESVTTAGLIDGEGYGDDGRNYNSAYKSVAANVFEAGHRVETALLMTSLGAYAILFLASRRKKKKEAVHNKYTLEK